MKAEGGRSSGRTVEGCPPGSLQKDSGLVKCIRQTYFRAHWPVFNKEVTHDLIDVFKDLAEMAGLLDTEIH